MGDNKNEIKLSWDEFILKGNPNNAPDEIPTVSKQKFASKLKVHYEKKGRGGKEALIIRGFDQDENHDLDALSKFLKSKLGVGGAVKDGEIIIQGNQRDKTVDLLKTFGFGDVKKSGG